MNLLVTNTNYPQAYDITRALRPYAAKIVATLEGESRLRARISHAANSRLVDRRYYVPSPARDWSEGRVGRENTEREEAFVKALLRICEAERIDVIYPSWDPHVYVLSKNLERFRALGVAVTVPEYETVVNAFDKYRAVRAAEEVGFPCPRTYLYDEQTDLKAIAEREGFPLVLKPRFTSGGRGMAIVRDYEELLERLPGIVERHGGPLIQEFIPGGHRDSVQFVFDAGGEARFVFHKRRHRQFRATARHAAVSESARPEEFAGDTSALVRKIGWRGAMGLEAIYDPRDATYKLLEINPRFPRQLWNRLELGVNEPLMCIRIARGESVETVEGYPAGVLFVCPFEDVQLLALQVLDRVAYRLRTGLARRAPVDALNSPPTVREQLRSFLRTYRGDQRKVFDPYYKYFFRDPLVSLIWLLQLTTWTAGGLKHLGK